MWRSAFRRFLKHHLAVVSALFLLAMSLCTCMAPILSSQDPNMTQAANSLEPPSSRHLLGTDDMGRDVLIRILYGGRASLTVGFLSALVSLVVGIVIGSTAGYYSGLLDSVLMRLTDLFLSFPSLFVVLVVNLLLRETQMSFLRTGIIPVTIVIGSISWMELARLVRASFLSLGKKDFVEAARALGAKNSWIASRHILPNSLAPIIVNSTLLVSSSILMESGLSYLGFGVQPPTATWGNMLNRTQTHFYAAPWLGIFPGLMICFTVVAINFIGDGLRDMFDPYTVY